MKSKKTVAVSGSIAYDDIMDFPGYFKDYIQENKLHQINVSFVVDRLKKQLGGTATNISYNLSLLSESSIIILGALGQDFADFTSFFKKHNITTDALVIDRNLYTSTGKVITDRKDNQIWGFYYGAAIKASKINLNKYVKNPDYLIISANHPNGFLTIQKHAITSHLEYMYDPGMALTWIKDSDLRRGVEHASCVIGNDYEIASIVKRMGKTARALAADGKIIITTLGEKGVIYEDMNKRITVSAYRKTKIVDPTGAGDAWRAGFVAGALSALPLVDTLKQANALASFAVEKYGTVNHAPSKSQIERRMKTMTVSLL
jgi:adenosine kinase